MPNNVVKNTAFTKPVKTSRLFDDAAIDAHIKAHGVTVLDDDENTGRTMRFYGNLTTKKIEQRYKQLRDHKAMVKKGADYSDYESHLDRQAALTVVIKSGGFINKPSDNNWRVIINNDIKKMRDQGLDIVSVSSARSRKLDAPHTSLWILDDFERIERIKRIGVMCSDQLMSEIVALLNTGRLIGLETLGVSLQSAQAAITAIRGMGIDVCTVKAWGVDNQPRGWIVPSVSNNLLNTTNH